jgi:hypothetical protein
MPGVRVLPSFEAVAVMLTGVYYEGCLSPDIREDKIRADQNVTQIDLACLWNLESFLSWTDKPSNSLSFVGCMNRNGR